MSNQEQQFSEEVRELLAEWGQDWRERSLDTPDAALKWVEIVARYRTSELAKRGEGGVLSETRDDINSFAQKLGQVRQLRADLKGLCGADGRFDPRRIAACLAACEGIETAQLEAMVQASEPGVLATAYDVCSSIWESHGIDLMGCDQVDDAEVDGSEAAATLLDLGPQVEQVVFWARKAGAMG